MKIIPANTRNISATMRLAVILAVIFFSLLNGDLLRAQDLNYHLGVRGGVGMSTLSGFENNGLRLGITAGGYVKFDFTENSSIDVELNYSTGGQQSAQWIDNRNEQLKIYSKYSLNYINLPIFYQYYFTDILGLEGGLNFRYCMGGSLKTKIGNEHWQKTRFGKDEYNSFDLGIILGIYTDNLIPHDNFFVSLRSYFGFLDVIKDSGSNKNISIQISIGYMLR